MFRVYGILAFWLIASVCYSATITWNGSSSSLWNNPANWTPAVVPGVNDLIVFNGTGNTLCALTENSEVAGIQIAVTYTSAIELNGFALIINGLSTSVLAGGTFRTSGATTLQFAGSSNVTFGATLADVNIGVNMNLTGTALLRLGPGAEIKGDLTAVVPRIFLNGITVRGSTTLTQNSPSTNIGGFGSLQASTGGNRFDGPFQFTNLGLAGLVVNGGNTFGAAVTLVNSGPSFVDSQIILGYTNLPDYFNGRVTLISDAVNGTGNARSQITMAHANSSFFNENIRITCTNECFGIYFGDNGGSSFLASGYSIAAPLFNASFSGSGFTSGGLLDLNRFNQAGTVSQNLLLDGESILRVNNSSWAGQVSFRAASLDIDNSTFTAPVTTHKLDPTSMGSNTWSNNSFNSDLVIEHTAVTNLSGAGNNFFGNLGLIKNTGSGTLSPCSAGCNVYKDVSISGTSTAAFNLPNITFAGTGNQNLNKTGSIGLLVMNGLVLNQGTSVSTVTLNTPLRITSNSLVLTRGVIKSDYSNTNVLTFTATVTASPAASVNSFVDGPIVKIGTSAFTFPLGQLAGGTSFYRPLGISAPISNSTFRARYIKDSYPNTSSMDPSLYWVSACEYWLLDRTGGTSPVLMTLPWVKADCSSYDPIFTDSSLGDLRVAGWNGSQWRDWQSPVTIAGSASAGSITTGNSITTFGAFTLAAASIILPLEASDLSGRIHDNNVLLEWSTYSESDIDYFSIARSVDGLTFSEIAKIRAKANSDSKMDYSFADENARSGKNYYKLAVVGLDEEPVTLDVISMILTTNEERGNLYPNPCKRGNALYFKKKGDYSILNTSGVTVLTIKNNNSVQLPDSMPPGIYVVVDLVHGKADKLLVFDTLLAD